MPKSSQRTIPVLRLYSRHLHTCSAVMLRIETWKSNVLDTGEVPKSMYSVVDEHPMSPAIADKALCMNLIQYPFIHLSSVYIVQSLPPTPCSIVSPTWRWRSDQNIQDRGICPRIFQDTKSDMIRKISSMNVWEIFRDTEMRRKYWESHVHGLTDDCVPPRPTRQIPRSEPDLNKFHMRLPDCLKNEQRQKEALISHFRQTEHLPHLGLLTSESGARDTSIRAHLEIWHMECILTITGHSKELVCRYLRVQYSQRPVSESGWEPVDSAVVLLLPKDPRYSQRKRLSQVWEKHRRPNGVKIAERMDCKRKAHRRRSLAYYSTLEVGSCCQDVVQRRRQLLFKAIPTMISHNQYWLFSE